LFPVADLEKTLISSEIIQENERLAREEMEGFTPAFYHLLVCLRMYSYRGNKHFARLKAGQLAGIYRLESTEIEMLRTEVQRLSNKPGKASKTFSDGLRWGKRCPAKSYNPKRTESLEKPSVASRIKSYCLRMKEVVYSVKNETLKAMGISPKEMGESRRKRVNGKLVRVHDLGDLMHEIKTELKEAQKREQEEQFAHIEMDLEEETISPILGYVVDFDRLNDELLGGRPPEPFETTDLVSMVRLALADIR
jgi:hypothetical protein